MKACVTREVDAPPDAVLAALRDLDGLSRWIGGILAHRVEARPGGTADVVLKMRAPRTLALRVEVEPLPDGLAWALVEGDPTTAEGRITVTPAGTGARVTWQHELAFAVAVPRLLLRELEEQVLPRWLAALGDAAR